MIKSGDKLYCYKSYIKIYNRPILKTEIFTEEIFTEGKLYTVGKLDIKNNIIGIVISDDSRAEFNMYYNSPYPIREPYYKTCFLTMAEYRDKQINEILDL